MENTMIKERICNLLESIVEKTESINRSSSPDYLIDVDLVIEDLKQLYKEFNVLKKATEGQLENEASLKEKAQLRSTDPASRTFPRTFVTPPPADRKEEEQEDVEATQEEEPKAKDANEYKDEQHEEQIEDVAEEKKDVGDEKEDVVEAPEQKEEETEKPKEKAKPEKAEQSAEEGEVTKENTGETEAEKEAETKEDVAEKTQEPKEVEVPVKPSQAKPNNKNASLADAVSKKPKSIGDKFVTDEDTSLNVKLAKMKEDMTIGTRMQHKPIKNLRESIGVNEKFLFINELFEGDIDAYNEAINKLNSFDNIDEAFDFINQLNNDFSWDEHHSAETIDKFAYLIQRRYMTN